MTTKISSILAIIFFSTAALAKNAYEFEYQIRNNTNGQTVSTGNFVAVEGQTNFVFINNPLSSLDRLELSVDRSFKTTMPGGDGVDLIKTKIRCAGIRINTSSDLDGNATFGDGKVNGQITIKRTQSFYFQNTSGITLDFSGQKIQDGTCIGGSMILAAQQIKRFDPSAITNEDSIEFNRTTYECLNYSDHDTDDRGGRVCLEWQTDVQHIHLPRCAE